MTITLAQSYVFDPVPGAALYRVEMRDAPGNVVKTVISYDNTVAATELFDGLQAGPTYRARVRAEAGSFVGEYTGLLDLVLEALGVPGNPRVE